MREQLQVHADKSLYYSADENHGSLLRVALAPSPLPGCPDLNFWIAPLSAYAPYRDLGRSIRTSYRQLLSTRNNITVLMIPLQPAGDHYS